MTNGYMMCELRAWRANCDFSYVANPWGCAIYTSKYSSKVKSNI